MTVEMGSSLVSLFRFGVLWLFPFFGFCCSALCMANTGMCKGPSALF